MAWLSNPPTRRQFLQTVIGGAAVYAVSPLQAADAPTTWAWLSDTHIPEKKPDGYRVCMALGNHDDRANFTKAFEPHIQNAQSVSNKHVVSVETPTARLVTLDSLLYVNKVAGLLGKDQRTWLETFLQAIDDKPVILFVHHTLDDSDGSLLDSDWLLNHVAAVPKVKAIVYGHSHVYRFEEVDGLHLINLPALGYNFRDVDPIGWVLAELRQDGVDLTLNAIGGDTSGHGKTTSLKWRS